MVLQYETEYEKGIKAYLTRKNSTYHLNLDGPEPDDIEGIFFRRLDTESESGLFKTNNNMIIKVFDHKVTKFEDLNIQPKVRRFKYPNLKN